MKNETCAGCVWWYSETYCCTNPINESDDKGFLGDPASDCLEFTPSLECRKVRALEAIQETLKFCSSWNANSGMSSWNVYHDKCEPGNRIKAMCDCKDDDDDY
jgi:hypothetical protein